MIGGSLGAQALNERVPLGMAELTAEQLPQIVHQAGEKHIAALETAYAEVGVSAHCVPFIEDMAGAYDWADLVICRAGALTVAELAAAGVASILVPFPHAVDDHQTGNARFLVNVGGAFLLPQEELTRRALPSCAITRAASCWPWPSRRAPCAKPNATRDVAQLCSEVAR